MVDAFKSLRLYFQHVLPKGIQKFHYGGIGAFCSRAKLHADQAFLNNVKAFDSVKSYIEKAFAPEVRGSFEYPNCEASQFLFNMQSHSH